MTRGAPSGASRAGDESHRRSARVGFLLGVAAFGMWGLFPVYFKAVAAVPALEVLAHRVLWSLLLLTALVHWQRQWSEARAAVRSPRNVLALAATSALIGGNWLLFIWAVSSGRIVQASLGYYVNPLVSVFLGVVLLRERLTRAASVAVALAALGVGFETAVGGRLPVVALVLAVSFGLYGLLRKVTPVGAVVGLLVEAALLSPLAVGFLLWAAQRGELRFGSAGASLDLLLVFAGPITVAPLYCFNAAARRLPLSRLGMIQYLSPSGQLLLAVLAYGEPFRGHQAVTFACIWAALAIITVDQVRRAR